MNFSLKVSFLSFVYNKDNVVVGSRVMTTALVKNKIVSFFLFFFSRNEN
jgi:hypothetical protein